MARRRGPADRPRDPFDPFDGAVDATLDLHGFRADEARLHVPRYIADLARREPGALLHIITGRGRGSDGGPVLRTLVRSLLRQMSGAGPIDAHRLDDAGGGYLVRLRR